MSLWILGVGVIRQCVNHFMIGDDAWMSPSRSDCLSQCCVCFLPIVTVFTFVPFKLIVLFILHRFNQSQLNSKFAVSNIYYYLKGSGVMFFKIALKCCLTFESYNILNLLNLHSFTWRFSLKRGLRHVNYTHKPYPRVKKFL